MSIFKSENIIVDGDTVKTRDWTIPKDLFYFNGHFPHNPVLPAVAIVDLSVDLVRAAFPKQFGALAAVDHAKFSFPLRPSAKTRIHATPESSGEWSVEWTDSDSSEIAAQLRLRLHTK